MSALDDVIEYATRNPDVGYHEYIEKKTISEAREELELLREAAFELARRELREVDSLTLESHPKSRNILRTDPDRAKAMRLGWAL